MLNLLASIIPSLFKLGNKMVLDKDKAAEYAFKIQDRTFDLLEKVVTMPTVKWVDALVKLIIASVVLARPLGTFFMTAFGIYAHYKGIKIDPTIHAMLDGAFPAWGVAREAHKRREIKLKEKQPYD